MNPQRLFDEVLRVQELLRTDVLEWLASALRLVIAFGGRFVMLLEPRRFGCNHAGRHPSD
jgi:hypothetical protein